MKKFRSLRSWMVAILTISSLTMCHKKEKEAQPTPQGATSSIQAVGTCTYTIKATETTVDGSAIPPGSTVCIEAGSRGPLLLKNYKGTPGSPITFINKGGKVVIQLPQTNGYGIKTSRCSNIKVLGCGAPGIKYGIEVNGTHVGVAFDDLSTDFEASNLEIHNTGFAGLFAKTDPTCDPATHRGNFVMKNISLHDNYIHNTGGEGFYVGNSFYASGHVLTPCGQVLPHEIWGCKVFNNITDQTGCEGVQVGCATRNCEIYNNTITNSGRTPFADAQNNGLQLGEGTGGRCYNNFVKNTPGDGLVCVGLGDNVVYNNIIVNSGSHGVFADSRATPGPHFQFVNNTIVNSGGDGFRLYSETIPMNTVMNNVIVQSRSGKAIYKRSANVKVTDANNYVSNDVAVCKFVNAAGDNFRIAAGSPMINTGGNASSYGISNDYYSGPRPVGGTFDIGASEYGSVVATPAKPPVTTPTKPATTAPAPTAPKPTGPVAVTSFTLVNALTNKDIRAISNGAVIDVAQIGTNRLSIRANTTTGAASVMFGYDARANFHTDNSAPHSLMGVVSGKYTAWIPSIGKHIITATPYGSANATGTKGAPVSITVTVK